MTEGHHQAWSLRLNLTQHGKTYQVSDIVRIDRLKIFLDSMGGGAWPFLVDGVICLVNSVNERDLSLLTSRAYPLSQMFDSSELFGRGSFSIGRGFLLHAFPVCIGELRATS